MITENLSTLKIHKLTQEQYNRELEADNIDENALYLTPIEEIDLSMYATVEQVNAKADLNHTHSDMQQTISDIQSQLDTKQSTITGAATTITDSNLTASRALMSDSSGKVGVSSITSTELDYLDGVTSNIQAQLDGKASSSHGTHVTFTTTTPKANGTASVGTATTVSRSDHVHPLQTTVSGNAGTSTKWANAIAINGMSVDGSADRINYGTCSTASTTVAKTVSCTGFTLITGAEITVKFTNTNTASSPTLNVNSTGAKAIYYKGAAIRPNCLKASGTYTFRYNGTQWDFVGDINSNGYTSNNSSYTELDLATNHKMTQEGIVQINGLITSTQYSSVWLKVNGIQVFCAQQEEEGGKTSRHIFSFRVYVGDDVMANATADGSLKFYPM